MPTILLTGFEAFAGASGNPTADAVTAYAARHEGPDRVVTAVLPVVFDAAAAWIRSLVEEHRPDAVLSFGLAGGSDRIAVERVALNLIDARIPDNAGRAPVDVPCIPGEPPARFATAPVKRIARAIQGAGLPARLSLSAGAYVCNHVFYTALSAAPAARVGFVHLPWSASTAPEGSPGLADEELVHAVEVAVRHVFDDEDSRAAGPIW